MARAGGVGPKGPARKGARRAAAPALVIQVGAGVGPAAIKVGAPGGVGVLIAPAGRAAIGGAAGHLPLEGPRPEERRRRAGALPLSYSKKLKDRLDRLGQEPKEGARDDQRYERRHHTPRHPHVHHDAPYRKDPLRERVRQKGP